MAQMLDRDRLVPHRLQYRKQITKIALEKLMWDSATRMGGLSGLNIGHLQFDQYGSVIIVGGKTGRMWLRWVSSVPDLQQWLNVNPRRTDPNYRSSSQGITVKCDRSLTFTPLRTLNLLARKVDIQKLVQPHGIRHTRLTDLASGDGIRRPGINEVELRLVAGWERKSAMPEV